MTTFRENRFLESITVHVSTPGTPIDGRYQTDVIRIGDDGKEEIIKSVLEGGKVPASELAKLFNQVQADAIDEERRAVIAEREAIKRAEAAEAKVEELTAKLIQQDEDRA